MKTAKDIAQSVATLNSVTGLSYSTERHMGQGTRLMCASPKGGEFKVSPILPSSALVDWIDAYTKGYEAAKNNRA